MDDTISLANTYLNICSLQRTPNNYEMKMEDMNFNTFDSYLCEQYKKVRIKKIRGNET